MATTAIAKRRAAEIEALAEIAKRRAAEIEAARMLRFEKELKQRPPIADRLTIAPRTAPEPEPSKPAPAKKSSGFNRR